MNFPETDSNQAIKLQNFSFRYFFFIYISHIHPGLFSKLPGLGGKEERRTGGVHPYLKSEIPDCC